jgi:hypothetical protein
MREQEKEQEDEEELYIGSQVYNYLFCAINL